MLEKYESAKSQHAAEVQEIEAYVEQIKSLSDERESLTLEFEKENDLLKLQMETGMYETGFTASGYSCVRGCHLYSVSSMKLPV